MQHFIQLMECALNLEVQALIEATRYMKMTKLKLAERELSDMFAIMITDKQAIPYGVAAQRAMYQAQK